MKEPLRFDPLLFFAGWLLTALGLVGTFLPILSAYSLPVYTGAFLAVGILLAGYLAVTFSLKKGRWFLILLLAAAWVFVIVAYRDLLALGVQVCAHRMNSALAAALGKPMPLVSTSVTKQQMIAATVFFAVVAVPVLVLYGWSIVSVGTVAPSIVVSVPCFALSMVQRAHLPSLVSVLLLILFWMLLLLPQRARRVSDRNGARLTFLYLPILTLLGTIILLSSPRETYVRAAWPDALRETLAAWRQEGVSINAQTVAERVEQVAVSRPTNDLDVQSLGPRRTTGAKVFSVTDSLGGTRYLRGSALGRYDGSAWREVDAPPMDYSPDDALAERLTGATNSLSVIHPTGNTAVCYRPYYARGGIANQNETYAVPLAKTDRYTWEYIGVTDLPEAVERAEEIAYRAWAEDAYTDLPESIAAELRSIAAENGIDGSLPREEIASRVAEYVKNCAVYDLNTPRTPTGEDFILYFLKTGRRGYCVHFASAATAMLQSLGVPARYVSGYAIDTQANASVDVTDEAAHAWVEVYFDGIGWIPYEATGSASDAPAATLEPTVEPTEGPIETPAPTGEPTFEMQTAETVDPIAPHNASAAEKSVSPWLLLFLLPVAIGFLALRYKRLLQNREARLRRGGAKKRILEAWRQLESMKPFGAAFPEELFAIAEEARFSDHAMADADAQMLIAHLKAERARLERGLPIVKKWVAKYLKVVL